MPAAGPRRGASPEPSSPDARVQREVPSHSAGDGSASSSRVTADAEGCRSPRPFSTPRPVASPPRPRSPPAPQPRSHKAGPERSSPFSISRSFAASSMPATCSSKLAALWLFLDRLFSGVAGLIPRSPWFATLLEWALLAAASSPSSSGPGVLNQAAAPRHRHQSATPPPGKGSLKIGPPAPV